MWKWLPPTHNIMIPSRGEDNYQGDVSPTTRPFQKTQHILSLWGNAQSEIIGSSFKNLICFGSHRICRKGYLDKHILQTHDFRLKMHLNGCELNINMHWINIYGALSVRYIFPLLLKDVMLCTSFCSCILNLVKCTYFIVCTWFGMHGRTIVSEVLIGGC